MKVVVVAALFCCISPADGKVESKTDPAELLEKLENIDDNTNIAVPKSRDALPAAGFVIEDSSGGLYFK